MRIAALTDHTNTPSSRFRVRQHIDRLAELGIHVTDFQRRYSTESAGSFFSNKRIREHLPKLALATTFEALNLVQTRYRIAKANSFDAIWLSREIIIGYPSFEKNLRRPLIYDLDDAVYLNKNSEKAIRRLLEMSAATLSGNEYLASYCRQYSDSVHFLPTAVDTEKFYPQKQKIKGNKFRIGWSGTSSSYFYFLPIQRQIAEFIKNHTDVELVFFADRAPTILQDLSSQVKFVPWDVMNEAEQIRSLDVGIMPIDNSEWSKGKCAYKLLLYAASGVPLIASNYGMNASILKSGKIGVGVDHPNQWGDALEHMYRNSENLNLLYPDGRGVVCSEYSTDKVLEKLKRIFSGLQPTRSNQ